MALVTTSPSQPRPLMAYAAGVMFAVLTLVIGSLIIQATNNSDSAAGAETATSDGDALVAGQCAQQTSEADQADEYQVVECDEAHDLQVSGRAEHPDAGGAYPGEQVMAVWYGNECETINNSFLGTDLLDTTLSSGIIVPDEQQWADDVHHAVCYITTSSADVELSKSAEDDWESYKRGDEVTISRLKAGDCFTPTGSAAALQLRSTDPVALVECDTEFNGQFFGRAKLPFPAGADLPGDDELTESSTAACATAFEEYFKVEATGFTYRFWRPSRTNWQSGDRSVLCAVLDDEPIQGPYQPAIYPLFYELRSGQCFSLIPEQTSGGVSLDDRVRPADCDEPHVGQMIGGGELSSLDDAPFPGDLEAQREAESECETLFTAFIGIRPTEAGELGKFPFWFPNESSWSDGDTRYACAILGDEVYEESLEDSES